DEPLRYFLVDRIDELQKFSHAVGTRCISLTEDCFEHHFPGHPVYPGSLLVESMAQLGGALLDDPVTLDHGAVAPRLLGFVERGVGPPQQLLEGCPGPTLDRSEARRERRQITPTDAGLELPPDRADDPQDRVGRRAREDDDELLAAEARDDVPAAHRGGQALREHAQSAVAGLVAEGVVEALEVVEIRHDEGHGAPGPRRATVLDVEAAAVEEPGQRVRRRRELARRERAQHPEAGPRLLGDARQATEHQLRRERPGVEAAVQHADRAARHGDREARSRARRPRPDVQVVAGVERSAVLEGQAVAAAGGWARARGLDAAERGGRPGDRGRGGRASQVGLARVREQQLGDEAGRGGVEPAPHDVEGALLVRRHLEGGHELPLERPLSALIAERTFARTDRPAELDQAALEDPEGVVGERDGGLQRRPPGDAVGVARDGLEARDEPTVGAAGRPEPGAGRREKDREGTEPGPAHLIEAPADRLGGQRAALLQRGQGVSAGPDPPHHGRARHRDDDREDEGRQQVDEEHRPDRRRSRSSLAHGHRRSWCLSNSVGRSGSPLKCENRNPSPRVDHRVAAVGGRRRRRPSAGLVSPARWGESLPR
ncbi:MAG: hypothetical protein CVT68_11205, partial [Actinobacteria bacterium HGW-Actinobacteria-8]